MIALSSVCTDDVLSFIWKSLQRDKPIEKMFMDKQIVYLISQVVERGSRSLNDELLTTLSANMYGLLKSRYFELFVADTADLQNLYFNNTITEVIRAELSKNRSVHTKNNMLKTEHQIYSDTMIDARSLKEAAPLYPLL